MEKEVAEVRKKVESVSSEGEEKRIAAVKAELFTMRFTEESGRYSVVTCKNRRSPVRRFLQYTTFSSFVGFVTCL